MRYGRLIIVALLVGLCAVQCAGPRLARNIRATRSNHTRRLDDIYLDEF